MNRFKVTSRIWGACATFVAAFFLMQCGNGQVASTEVENELARFDGVVATGMALSGARVELICTCNQVLASDTTDLYGNYSIQVPSQESRSPYLIRAVWGSDTLSTLVLWNSQNAVVNTNRHINPLTHELTKKVQQQNPWTLMDSLAWELQGTALLAPLFGSTVSWRELDRDSAFRAWVPADSLRASSPTDALLHSLMDMATLQNIGLGALIERQIANAQSPLFLQAEFQNTLVQRMTLLPVDTIEGRQALQDWYMGQPELQDQMLTQFQELRRLRNPQELPATIDGQVFRVVQNTVAPFIERGTISMAEGPMFMDLSKVVVLNALLPIYANPYDLELGRRLQPYVDELANKTVQVLLAFTAEERLLKTAWVLQITDSLVQVNVVSSFDVTALALDESGTYYSQNYQTWDSSGIESAVESSRQGRGSTEINGPSSPMLLSSAMQPSSASPQGAQVVDP